LLLVVVSGCLHLDPTLKVEKLAPNFSLYGGVKLLEVRCEAAPPPGPPELRGTASDPLNLLLAARAGDGFRLALWMPRDNGPGAGLDSPDAAKRGLLCFERVMEPKKKDEPITK
jgi:hypothetical protein